LSVTLAQGTAVLVHGRLGALRDVRTRQAVEVTGVLNGRTHTMVGTYSIVQD
jgi:hypothetical protein